MKIKNRTQLLGCLRAKAFGYNGPAELAAVEKFVADEGIELIDDEGPINIKSVWDVKAKLVDPGDEDEGKEAADLKAKQADIERRESELSAKQAEIDGLKAKIKDDAKEVRGKDFGKLGASARMSPTGFKRAADHKSYNARPKTKGFDPETGKLDKGRAFDEAEQAEQFGAWMKSELLPKLASPDDIEIVTKANITTTNTAGGALIPDIFLPTMIDLKEIYGVTRQVIGTTPMTNDKITMPRRTGGLTVYAPGEAGSITESNPTVDNVSIVATKLATLTNVSSELINDSAINFGDFVGREAAYAFAKAEDNVTFNGDGTSTYYSYQGICYALKNLSGTIANIAGLFVGAGNAYSELTLADFQNVIALSPSYVDAMGNPAWYVHKTFYHNAMQRVALAAGGVTANEAQTTGYTTNPMFLNYRVKFVQQMPRVEANSQVSALFGDLSMGSKFGEVRGGMTLATSTDYAFNQDVVTFRATERVGWTTHDVGNASATAASRVPGPIVGLITAAS